MLSNEALLADRVTALGAALERVKADLHAAL
jgi:hypothetical protein